MDAKDGRCHGSALTPKTWCSSNGCDPDVVSLQTCQELDCAFEIVKFEASACARTACVARRWPAVPARRRPTSCEKRPPCAVFSVAHRRLPVKVCHLTGFEKSAPSLPRKLSQEEKRESAPSSVPYYVTHGPCEASLASYNYLLPVGVWKLSTCGMLR